MLKEDGRIDRKKMAAAIFSDGGLLKKVNGIIHPAVKEHILEESYERERQAGEGTVFFLGSGAFDRGRL